MEIDITAFVVDAIPCEFSASRAELGNDAGKITWNNAKREAVESPLLPPDATRAFNDWIRGFGAWEPEEIESWGATERNALLIQYISGNLRELESLCPSEGNDDENDYGIDWDAARDNDQVSGRIYRGDDGRVYFYMGN